MSAFDWWPFVTKHAYRQLCLENMTLRDALREANKELLLHRSTIGALAVGHTKATDEVMKIFSGAKRP